ncbi:MAG TPA: SDR family oxidoreductase [Candidatus Binatia bacterium]|nr:SDR family oxidoreductase [Candidatus Binatia bacterium]
MSFSARKVLVIGGAGYVGSVLVEELLKRGYAVKVFDRLIFGDEGLRAVRDRVELVTGDMRAMEPGIFEDVMAVVNLGGLSNDPTAEFNPAANYEMNTVATEQAAKQAKEAGVRRYLLASTCSIYDRGVEDLDADLILDETADVSPRAAYSSSKFEAERRLLPMADETFCPVILRKGTVYGYSPRMRFDLVVNTFVKDALTKGRITIHFGGEMWRPLVDVRDVARAYIACLEADEAKVRGQIFNVLYRNMRISELALRVKEALASHGLNIAVAPDYGYEGVRNYRVSGRRIETVLDFRPIVSIEESVATLFERLRATSISELENPRYYNIRWLKLLEEAEQVLGVPGALFGVPRRGERVGRPALRVSA